MTRNCDGVVIDNMKICGSRMINDDALDLVNTQNATVRNCFFRTQDDSIAIKGLAKMPRPCENILIEDCEFWTDAITRLDYDRVSSCGIFYLQAAYWKACRGGLLTLLARGYRLPEPVT